MLINILTLLMGTAMIIFKRPQSGLMSGCKNWPAAPSSPCLAWRAKHGEREIQAGKVANVLIGIGVILIAITGMMKGLVIDL